LGDFSCRDIGVTFLGKEFGTFEQEFFSVLLYIYNLGHGFNIERSLYFIVEEKVNNWV
jgi:hypothetical protein